MSVVRSAIHIRTGQQAAARAVDDWLARHQVAVLSFDDPYDACVHLLRRYERIPDLALIGADWLAADELNIVSYLRQTWPHTGLVIYGGDERLPLFDLLPLTRTCRSPGALERLLSESPTDVLRHVYAAGPRPAAAPRQADATHRQVNHLPQVRSATPASEPDGRRTLPEQLSPTNGGQPVLEAPRAVLTAEELSALLDSSRDD